MRDRRIRIPAGGATQVRGNTKRVVVREASGPFIIETDKAEVVEAAQGDNIAFDNVAKWMQITNGYGGDNVIILTLSSSGEGDLTSSSGVTVISNSEQLTAGASGCDIRNYTMDGSVIEILSADVVRRCAVISTSQEINVMLRDGGPVFTVAGALTHDANGVLYAQGAVGAQIQVMEYLN